MNDLLNNLVESAKKNKHSFRRLKELVTECQQYVRDIEKEVFPESAESKEAKKVAKELVLLFRLVGLNISDHTCWLIHETIKEHNSMGSKFDVITASNLLAKQKALFDLKPEN